MVDPEMVVDASPTVGAELWPYCDHEVDDTGSPLTISEGVPARRRERRCPKVLIGAALVVIVATSCGDDPAAEDSSAVDSSATTAPASTVAPGPATSAGSVPDAPLTSTGVVTDASGRPVPGATLELMALDGQPDAAAESLRRTDAEGRYHLAVAPGRWALTVSAGGFRPEEVVLDVPSSGTVERDIELEGD